MSNKKRNVYSSKFKLERALEAISSDNVAEVARKYNLGTNLLCLWKKQLIERGTTVFDSSPDKSINQLKAKVSRLEQMIGKKEIELNLLKNFSDFYSSQRDT